MLPTFLVIGAMKAGTTSLYYYLAEHPEIGMSRRKETDFFMYGHGNWARGRDWYRRQFPADAPVRGECSPNYTKRHLFGGVPERIEAVCPSVKLIYMVRDPIERTVSHYQASCQAAREDRPFAAAVADADESNYVLTSCYHTQLQPYLHHFPKERLLVVSTEEMTADPQGTMRTLYRFLGVDASFQNEQVGRSFNVSAEKKQHSPWVRWVSDWVPQALKDRLRPHLSLNWLPGTAVPRPAPSPEVEAHLTAVFRPEVEALRTLTGRDFAGWCV